MMTYSGGEVRLGGGATLTLRDGVAVAHRPEPEPEPTVPIYHMVMVAAHGGLPLEIDADSFESLDVMRRQFEALGFVVQMIQPSPDSGEGYRRLQAEVDRFIEYLNTKPDKPWHSPEEVAALTPRLQRTADWHLPPGPETH